MIEEEVETYEKEVRKTYEETGETPERIRMSVLKFYWKRSLLAMNRQDAIPNYLRKIKVLENFDESELRILCNFLHKRSFMPGEVIFKQGDSGFGMYFILNGTVDILAQRYIDDEQESPQVVTMADLDNWRAGGEERLVVVAQLDKYDYFGELALLQSDGTRTAMGVARKSALLLGIFKPDLEELINLYPTVGAKLVQSIAVIVANRFTSVTNEIRNLKYRIYQLEKGLAK